MNASRALSSEFSRRLNGDMRHWIAADAAVTLRQPPSEEQRGAMAGLARQGIEESESLETYSMASSDQAADPVVVSVRSVDARRYPWYGTVELEPNRPLREMLGPDTVVVSRILAERLAVAPGDRVLLNGVAFRVAAVLIAEPDRLAAAPNPYPRVMLSDAAFVRTRIARLGNAIVFRLLFRMGAGTGNDTGQLKARLQQVFPDGQVVDYRDHGDRRVAAALDATLTYLGLAAWTALALGSLGVAMVTYLHMEQGLDTVAIMKALGGRWRQILWIYLLEITCLSLAGCVLGAALAIPLERVFPLIFADQLPFPLALPWRWTEAAEAVGLGLLSSLVATAMPLVAVRTTAPLLLLRRYVEPSPGRRQIGRMVGMASLLGMLGLALWMVHSWKAGAAFLFGLAAGGLILLGTGRALLRMVRCAARRWRIAGVGSLSRPGRRADTRFLALAVGIMVVTASWLGPAAVVRAIQQSLPLPGADLFVFGLGPGQTAPLMELLAGDPDVMQPVELLPLIVLRLSKVAGVSVPATTPGRWVAACYNLAPSGPLSAGRWWQPGGAQPETVVSESLAGMMGAKVGQTLEFFSNGRAIPARIVGLRRLDAVDEVMAGLVFPCTAFAGLSVFYEAGISVKTARAEAVRRLLAASFPSVPVIDRREITAAIQSVAHDARWILRAVALLILLAGTAVLILMVLAEEKTRTREIAILKALGARPAQVRNALLAEFAWLGALAGASGGLMGSAFATLLLSVALRKASAAWDARVFAGAVLLGILTAVGAGWASSARMLRQKPLAILRDE
jgi:putative ABC transport system permease protein